MRVAAIDLGTFSAILLVAEVKRGRLTTLLEERRTVDLEYGASNALTLPAIRRAADALRRFNRKVKEFEVDRGMIVATAAIRHARNRSQAVEKLKGESSLPFKILSAKREAEYSAKGALIGLPRAAPITLIVDIGGGSSEFIKMPIGTFCGLPIGAAWATKAWSPGAPRGRARRDLHYLTSSEQSVLALDTKRFGDIATVVGLGGTIATLAAIRHRMRSFDIDTVHGTSLSRAWIECLAAEMSAMPKQLIRELVPFDTSRARVLLAGTYLWSAVLNRLNVDRVMVSARGLRWGVAAHLAGLP